LEGRLLPLAVLLPELAALLLLLSLPGFLLSSLLLLDHWKSGLLLLPLLPEMAQLIISCTASKRLLECNMNDSLRCTKAISRYVCATNRLNF
jgi:hypothetical protein